ncbi:hypothetical protein AS026_10995 [Rhizobium altiplani]|uniref:Uncharacterized protein n=1 Tax=Rhizobium altiplani TaxID=1864509 RepID=A0A120FJH2_9HYPH|nr:hypothetical protein AS026_10995 [Rhizobium altiplani]
MFSSGIRKLRKFGSCKRLLFARTVAEAGRMADYTTAGKRNGKHTYPEAFGSRRLSQIKILLLF